MVSYRIISCEGVWRGGYDLNSTPRVYQQLPDGKWGYVEIVDTPQEGKHLLVNFDGVLLYYYDPGTGQYGTAYSHYAVPLGAYPISKADYDTLLGRGQLSIQADIQKALAITAERDKGTKAVMDTETRVASHAPGLKMAPMELIPNSLAWTNVVPEPQKVSNIVCPDLKYLRRNTSTN